MNDSIELDVGGDLWEGLQISALARSPAAARVVARLAPRGDRAGLELHGQVDGPFCAHTRTLRAKFPLRRRTDADPLLTVANLVEPCFWSGELPFLYQVELELRRGADVVAATTREIGIRPIGVDGPQIVLAGAQIVFRAVDPRALRTAPTLEAWRDSNTTLLAHAPDAALCAACARSGVMLLADFSDGATPRLPWDALGRCPAVMAVILPRDVGAPPPWEPGGPLRALDMGSPELPSRSACDLWHADFDAIEPEAWRRYEGDRAGLLSRRIEPCATVDEARGQCDRLQRDAASRGQFSGYLVRA